MKKSLSISCKSANTIGNYQIIKNIGKGLTAEVFEAVSRNSEKVSIKTISSNFYKS